MQEKYKKNP